MLISGVLFFYIWSAMIGKIFQKYDGLDFYRERRYELQADGHFKVVWESIVDR